MTKPPIFVVSGSRVTPTWKEFVGDVLDRYADIHGLPETLAHGNAHGIDALANAWAKKNGVTPLPFNADWDTHEKAAGPLRNSAMIAWASEQYDAGRCVLFIAFPGKKGTNDCLRKAKRAGLTIRHWTISSSGVFSEHGTPATRERAP